MKILMLTPYLPYPLLSGGQIRTYNLLKKLANKHDITLFSLIKDYNEKKYVKYLKPFCHKVRVFKRSKHPFTLSNITKTAFSSYPFLVIRNYVPEAISAITNELEKNNYDLIHSETFYMMPHLPPTNIPIILVEQTIEYLGYQSYAKRKPPIIKQILNVDIQKIINWEKHFWNLCDKLIVMSDEDKDYIKNVIKDPKKIEVVANGVDTQWFDQKKRKLPKTPTLLSVGTFKWLPNIEAVTYLVEKVWPYLKKMGFNGKLWIVGNAPTKKIILYGKKNADITVSGRIEDIRNAFKKSHILIAPVFSGKGTRYKIIEAMASGTPVVGTPIAVEGLEVQNNENVLIANNAENIAKSAMKLLKNKTLWNKLSNNGHDLVKKRYDWKLISKKLDKIYKEFK